jgi:very-short-patch-repair endonuclease
MANEIARSLRKRMTLLEVKLWVHLRSWRKRGFHFRRQAPRDGYVVDFVCLKHRLMVEVDGGQHNAARDNHFAGQGFRVLRFWNNKIDRNLDGVLTMIDDALRNPPPGLASLGHPPPTGEESS